MNFETILPKEADGKLTITFNREISRNSISTKFLQELNQALDLAEKNSACRMVVLEGQNGIFCTGMDFNEVAETLQGQSGTAADRFSRQYMNTVKRFSLMPKVIVSKVDGQVLAGGVGLAAASDIVIATSRSTFALSEALWGLLPAMVLPYLIRRVGYQKAFNMTLTTAPVSAQEAFGFHLVDEISETPDLDIHRQLQRLLRLEVSTIGRMKEYFRKIWIITEGMEEMAVSETSGLMSHRKVMENIQNFVNYKKFPWNT